MYRKDKRLNEFNSMVRRLIGISSSMPVPPYFLNKAVVSFCGTAYPLYEYRREKIGFFSVDDVVSWLRKKRKTFDFDPKGHLEEILERPKKEYRYWRYYRTYGNLTPDNWKKFEENLNPNIGDAPHIYFKTPVLSYGYSQEDICKIDSRFIIRNPSLKDYSFYKKVDPFNAYQQLSMYVGNNLAQQMDPNPPISDELRAHSHGFDKWSFRKHSEDSKKPRRRKK